MRKHWVINGVKFLLVFWAGWFIGDFIYWCFIDLTGAKALAYRWQSLLGSLLGAATPLSLFLLTEWYQQRKRQREYFFLLEKNLITAINNLSSIDRTLHAFQQVQLASFKKRIEEDDAAGRPSVGQAFVPLSWSFTFDKDLFKETTGSSYLENLVMQVVSTSQELPIYLQDLSRQFDRILTLNTQIGLMKLNSPAAHNQIVRENIEEFEKFLALQTFGNNIPVYLRMLVQTKVALQARITMGLREWKKTFPFPSPFTPETSDKMSQYFKPEVDRQIKELQSDFGSPLLLVGEQPPNPYAPSS